MVTLIFKSRRFWLLILDTVISLVSLVIALQFDKPTQDLVKTIILALQPVFIALIAAFTVDDVNAAKLERQMLANMGGPAKAMIPPESDLQGRMH